MIFKQLLLIVVLILIRNDKQYYAENQTKIGNIAELYNFPDVVTNAAVKNISKSKQTKLKQTKPYEIGNIADLYLFDSPNISKVYYNHATAYSGNKTNEKSSNISQSMRRQLKDSKQTNMEILANLYSFSSTNTSHTKTQQENKINSNLYKNHTNSHLNNESTIASMSELFCSYDNTINISKYSALANGSYIYNNHTLIPPQLVGNYDYEILYNGSKRSVPTHTRACICQLKHCITLCSNSITQFYQDVINDEGEDDFMSLFSIKMTLANKTVVTQNIAADFEHIILNEFCIPFYTLSPEKDRKLGWTFFEVRVIF